MRKKSFTLLKNWIIWKINPWPILQGISQIAYSRRTRYSSLGNIHGTSSNNTWIKGSLQKIGTRLDMLIDQRLRCYNCNDLENFAKEYKKLKQVKKDKDYLETGGQVSSSAEESAKRKAYIVEGKVLG